MRGQADATLTPIEPLVERLRRFDPERDYYALSLIANKRGAVGWSAHTHFVGMSSERLGWEIREASLVDPAAMAKLWGGIGEYWLVVEGDLALRAWVRLGGHALVLRAWVRLGGHALVQPTVARRSLAMMLGPHECAPDGPIGYVRTASLRSTDSSRRGSRKVRQEVIE